MSVAVTGFAAANDGQTGPASTISVTVPATANTGDVGVFFALSSVNAATFTPPSGWTSVSGPNTSSNNLTTQLFVKDITAGEPGTSESWSTSSGRFIGLMVTYSGAVPASLVTAATPSLATTASATIVEPSATTTADSSYVAGFWSMRVATVAPAPTLTYPGTETFDGRSRTAFTSSPNYTLEASHLTTPGVAGSYGGASSTASASTTNRNTYALILAPLITAAVTAAGAGGASLSGSVGESGALSAAAVGAADVAGSVSEPGALIAAGTGAATVAATVSESGAVTATGLGAATVAGSTTTPGAVSAAGVGAATVDGSVTESGAVAAAGVGAATVAGSATESGAVSAAGVGSATAAGLVTEPGALTAAGVGAATVAGTPTATGAVAAAAVGAASVAVLAASSGALSAAGVAAASAAGPVTESAAVSAAGVGAAGLSGTHTATGALTAAGTGSATLAGSTTAGVVPWVGSNPWNASDPWPGPDDTGTLPGAVHAAAVGVASLAGSHTAPGAVTAAGSGSATIAGTFIRSGALTAAGVGAASLPGTSVGSGVAAGGVGAAAVAGQFAPGGALAASGSGAATVAGRLTWFAALAAAGVGAATAAGPVATYLIPDTIPFDGTGTGVVAAINSWLAGLPNGSTAQFQPNGIYKQGNQPVLLTDRSDFTLDFNGATLVADADYAGSLRPAVRVTGGSNVQVKNLTVQGRLTFLGPYTTSYTSADEWQHGVHFEGHNGGGTRANVTNCTILNVYGDGVALDPDKRPGGSPLWIPCTNMLIENNTINGTGRMGCSVTFGGTVTFQDMTILRNNWWTIDVETETAEEYTNNITVQRITAGAMRYGLVSVGGGQSNQASNILIQNNTMQAMGATCQAPITALGPSGVSPHRTGIAAYSNTLLCYQTAGSFTRHDNVSWVGNTATSTAGTGGCGADYHVGLVDVIGAYLAGNSHPNTSALYHASGTTSGVIVGGVQVGAVTAAGVGSAAVAGSTTASTASGAVSAAGVGAASIAATFIRSAALTAAGVGGAVVVDQQSPGFGTAPFGTSPFGGDVPPTGDGFGLQPFGNSPFGGAITAALLAAGVATATVNVSGTKTGALNAVGIGSATVTSVVSHPGGLTAVGVATATVGGTVTVTAGLVANGVASAVLADTGLVVGRLTATGVGTATVTGLATKFGGLTAAGVASATVAGHIPSDFRDITLTVGPLRFRVLTATLRGGPVIMSRLDRTYVEFDVTVTLPDGTTTTVTSPSVALLPIPATPSAAVMWSPTTITDGVATVLVAGPDADPAGAVVLPGSRNVLYLRDVDNPEVQAVPVGRINLD